MYVPLKTIAPKHDLTPKGACNSYHLNLSLVKKFVPECAESTAAPEFATHCRVLQCCTAANFTARDSALRKLPFVVLMHAGLCNAFIKNAHIK